MNDRTPMSDDAAKGAALVAILFVVAVAQGSWLIAAPCALLLTLTVLSIL